MNYNNINNSGDGNIFNQNIGENTIHGLSNVDQLADQWNQRKRNVKRTRRSRLARSTIELVVGVILLLILVFIIYFVGGFNEPNAIFDLITAFSVELIVSATFLIIGSILTMTGLLRFRYESDDEKRNKQGMKIIDERVVDLGYTKKEWRAAKKRQLHS
ncbi:hypothetical protein [Corynebacterium cystitidis]|uniref:hypothetical protein n=1 Tax=Corynebacterium cystitidis TaxID=35757 RepID=UPI00211EA66E|nr:hypothetical protein [Corynebacterium cystitidis]